MSLLNCLVEMYPIFVKQRYENNRIRQHSDRHGLRFHQAICYCKNKLKIRTLAEAPPKPSRRLSAAAGSSRCGKDNEGGQLHIARLLSDKPCLRQIRHSLCITLGKVYLTMTLPVYTFPSPSTMRTMYTPAASSPSIVIGSPSGVNCLMSEPVLENTCTVSPLRSA